MWMLYVLPPETTQSRRSSSEAAEGLSQFEKVRNAVNSELWIPENIAEQFKTFHKKETLFKQNNRSILSTLLEKNDLDFDTVRILELISEFQGGLDQEIFYPVEADSQT